MHAEQRQDEQRFGDVIAVGDRVERIGKSAREAERGGGAVGVDRQRRSGECTGAEGRDVHARESIEDAPDVPFERPGVCAQMVREEHGLCPLQMGVAGQVHRPVGMRIGLVGPRDEHVDEAHRALSDGVQLATHEQAQRRCDLVVATAGRVHLAADFAGDLGDAPFDRRVDVLVSRLHDERPRAHLVGDRVQRGADRGCLVRGENAAGPEHVDVGERAGDVVEKQSHVETDAVGVRTQRVGTRRREAAVPQRPSTRHACRSVRGRIVRRVLHHLAPRCGASPAIVRRSLASLRAP